MGFYDWMLALHVLAAFSVAAALVLYTVLVLAGRRMTTLEQTRTLFRVAPVGGPLIGAGLGVVLLVGVVLAIDHDEFRLWDGWIVAALVMWGLFGWVSSRSGNYYTETQRIAESGDADAEADVIARLRAPTGVRWHLASLVLFVLIVLVMVFKPGA